MSGDITSIPLVATKKSGHMTNDNKTRTRFKYRIHPNRKQWQNLLFNLGCPALFTGTGPLTRGV